MKQQRISAFLTSVIILAAGAAIVLHPQEISSAVLTSLTLCTDTLLPSLFPFFVLSSLAIRLDLFRPLSLCLRGVMAVVFHLPGTCAPALILGIIGGYPTGAKAAAELYRSGLCSRDETERLLSFCSNCGPAFLFGVVGCGIFASPNCGLLLAGVHYAAAILTGFVLNRRGKCPDSRSLPPKAVSVPLTVAFVDSVTGAMRGMLDLFSFVLCFAAVTQLLSLSGLSGAASRFLLPFLPAKEGEALLLGLLEMTRGVASLPQGTLTARLVTASALIGWGGLSVHCQVLALLRDTDLSAAKYLQGKLLHSIFSALLMWGILYNLNLTCLTAGGALLILPRSICKKSSGKSAKGIV